GSVAGARPCARRGPDQCPPPCRPRCPGDRPGDCERGRAEDAADVGAQRPGNRRDDRGRTRTGRLDRADLPAADDEGRRPMITVAVVDDQEMVRMGFSLILDAEVAISVIGQAADGAEAIDLARRERPDVVLLDIRMPRLDGLAALPKITPHSKVIMVTTFDDEEYVDAALDGGA